MRLDALDDFAWGAVVQFYHGVGVHGFQIKHCRADGVGFGLGFAGQFFLVFDFGFKFFNRRRLGIGFFLGLQFFFECDDFGFDALGLGKVSCMSA